MEAVRSTWEIWERNPYGCHDHFRPMTEWFSDIRAIAEAVHEFGIPLIVDEAHGAHFRVSSIFSGKCKSAGADVVIHSVQKTLPAPTQNGTSFHMNGNLADREGCRKYLCICFNPAVPSYILDGIDAMWMDFETKRMNLFSKYADRLQRTRKKLGKLKESELEESGNILTDPKA